MHRRELVVEGMVHALRVVPEAPGCKSAIESGNIKKELSAMMIRILFLHGAVEAFAVGVLLWCLGTSLVVREVERADRIGKVLLEL